MKGPSLPTLLFCLAVWLPSGLRGALAPEPDGELPPCAKCSVLQKPTPGVVDGEKVGAPVRHGAGWKIRVKWTPRQANQGYYLPECWNRSNTTGNWQDSIVLIDGVYSPETSERRYYVKAGTSERIESPTFRFLYTDPCQGGPRIPAGSTQGSMTITGPVKPPTKGDPREPGEPVDGGIPGGGDDEEEEGVDPNQQTEESEDPCPEGDFVEEECEGYEKIDPREAETLPEPVEVEIVAENIAFSHKKRGFPQYNNSPTVAKPKYFLEEYAETELAGGRQESPVGGSITQRICPMTGEMIVTDLDRNPSFYPDLSGPNVAIGETTASGSYDVTSYDDCPNDEPDEPGVMSFAAVLSDEYTTDRMKKDASDHAWKFKADGYFMQAGAVARLLIDKREENVRYQKTQYKIRVPADLPRPYKVAWVEAFTPEDEDPDDDEIPEVEYTVKTEEVSGAESDTYPIDPKDKEGEWRVFLVHADLDVDSDNNNAKAWPDRSKDEEIAQRYSGTATPEKPGKMLFVHGGDEDYDGIPDYADGFSDLFQEKGIQVGGAPEDQGRLGDAGFVPQGAGMVPLAYDISPGSIPESKVVIKFEYPESDPSGVQPETEAGSGRNIYKLPDQGGLRLWVRNCDTAELRSVKSIAEGGHFIPNGEEFTLEDFRRYLSEAGSSGIFVESVRASEQIRDQSVKLHVGIATGGTTKWAYDEEVHFSSLDMALMAISAGGGTSRANGIGVSHSSPVIKLSTCQVSKPRFDYSRGEWVVDIDVTGTIKSKYLDTIPEAQGGVIREAFVHVNASDEPVETLAVTVQKGRNVQDLARPFPYDGSFSKKLVGITAVDGINVVTVRTQDQTFQIDGVVEAAYTIDLPETVPPHVSPDPGNPGGNPGTGGGTSAIQTTLTYQLKLLDGLVPEAVNHAVFTTTSSASPGSSEMLALTETAADSLLFADTGAAVGLRLPPDFSPSPDRVDQVVITLVDAGGEVISSLLLGENGENTNEYVASISSWIVVVGSGTEAEEVPVVTTTPVVVYQTDGGEFHPYAYQVAGPKELVESFTELKFTDGVGETEETGDGSASQSFTANLAEAENELYLANKIEPQAVAVVAFRENIEEDRFPSVSDEIYLNISRLQNQSLYPQNWGEFSKGFGMGLVKGGIDMVGGLGDAAKLGCKAVYHGGQSIVRGGVFALKCLWKTATGQSLEEEVRQVQEAKAKLNKRLEFFEELKNKGPMVVESILSGDFKKLDNLSGSMRTMVSFGAELFGALVDQLTDPDEYKRGIFWGRATFEIGSSFFAVSKLGTIAKVKFFEKIKLNKFFQKSPGAEVLERTEAFQAALKATRMCFVGGTLVWTAHGKVPIEDVRPGNLVWSRAESGGDLELKPVVETFRTHPEKLLELRCDHDGDGSPDETVAGTAQHPFWCEEAQDFVPLGSLKPGQTLWLADGRPTAVLSVITQRGPPGQRHTTYNFEVADFHTYFITESGIWVHNSALGKSPCDEAFGFIEDLTKAGARLANKPWKAFEECVQELGKDRNSSIFGWAADEVMRRKLRELPLGERIKEWPSHSEIKKVMEKAMGKASKTDLKGAKLGQIDVPSWVVKERLDLNDVSSLSLESHHGVPKKVQEWLGLTKDKDSVPAYLTTMLEHRASEIGIHQRLAQKMGGKINSGPVNLNQPRPAALTDDLIKEALQETYESYQMGHFWEVCEHWLRAP